MATQWFQASRVRDMRTASVRTDRIRCTSRGGEVRFDSRVKGPGKAGTLLVVQQYLGRYRGH